MSKHDYSEPRNNLEIDFDLVKKFSFSVICEIFCLNFKFSEKSTEVFWPFFCVKRWQNSFQSRFPRKRKANIIFVLKQFFLSNLGSYTLLTNQSLVKALLNVAITNTLCLKTLCFCIFKLNIYEWFKRSFFYLLTCRNIVGNSSDNQRYFKVSKSYRL